MGDVGRSSESTLQSRSESVHDTAVASYLSGRLRHVATAGDFGSRRHVDSRIARPGSMEARNDILVNHGKSGTDNCVSVNITTVLLHIVLVLCFI